MEADVVEAGIRRQTGLGAGGAIEHGGQARLLDGLEHRHLLRDAAPGTRQELLHAGGKVHEAREVDGARKDGLGHLQGSRHAWKYVGEGKSVEGRVATGGGWTSNEKK